MCVCACVCVWFVCIFVCACMCTYVCVCVRVHACFRFGQLLQKETILICLEKEDPHLTFSTLSLLSLLVRSEDMVAMLCTYGIPCVLLTCYQCLLDPPSSAGKELACNIQLQARYIPLHITSVYHLCISPLHITSVYHLCISPLHITSAYHLCISPLHITSAYHLCISPLHITSAYHLCISPLHITSAYHLCIPGSV